MSGKERTGALAWIWRMWRRQALLISALVFLTLLSAAVAVSYPLLSKLLLDSLESALASRSVDRSAAGAAVDRILLLMLSVGAAGLVANLFPGVRGITNSFFEHMIRSSYFSRVMDKDFRFFAAFRTGDVATRLTDDIYGYPKLSWFLCSGIFRAVESIAKILFCLVAMFVINPRLTLWSLTPLPVMIAVFYAVQNRIYDTFRRNQEAVSDINAQLELSFSGVRVIKAYACEEKYRRFFSSALSGRFGTELAVIKLDSFLALIYQYIDLFAQIAVVFAGGLMAVRGEITVGTFYAFYTYLGMLVHPILDIPQLFVSGKRALVNIDRLEELDRFPDPPKPREPVEVSDFRSVEAKDLGFSYPGRREAALVGVDLRLTRGERLCVVGPVGSGKTTLVRALAGLVEPSSGSVLIDGADLRELDGESWRRLVGYVPQEALLFSGTIRENVEFGADEPKDELFRAAVEAAQLGRDLESMPSGADTVVGQRGLSLSGGQKQRVAVARALIRTSPLLLLDDVTASLDAANEERLMEALGSLSRDQTVVMVSHRLSTLRYADRVLFMDRGRAVACGSHGALLGNPAYAAFIAEHLRGGRSES